MSLLTQKQLEEIQNFHDDIGECTEPHEECFIKKLIEWNEKQSAMLNQEVLPVGYLYKQQDCYGDIQTAFSFDKPYITWHNVTDVAPVYLEPPQRVPLSDEEINAIDLPEKQCTIIELVRIIEKTHGIGVVE
jgi:hypothetical protein